VLEISLISVNSPPDNSNLDTKLKSMPSGFINFVTRTVFGAMWAGLLHVAEDVKEGKRPQHKEAIEEKTELYRWMEERVNVMLANLKAENGSQG
jgi:hypothetical protein